MVIVSDLGGKNRCSKENFYLHHMTRILQVKDHKEHNKRLLIGPLIPLQRHSFLPKFSLHSSKILNMLRIIIFPSG